MNDRKAKNSLSGTTSTRLSKNEDRESHQDHSLNQTLKFSWRCISGKSKFYVFLNLFHEIDLSRLHALFEHV